MDQELIVSTPLKDLITAFQVEETERKISDQEPKIKVGVAVSALAFIYEKVRMAVDYKEDHLLRKNAIERVLKRYFTGQMRNNIAEAVIKELVRARYLKNESVPETKLEDLKKVIEKYSLLHSQIRGNAKQEVIDWMIGIAACEMDGAVASADKREALVNFMYQTIRPQINVSGLKINEKNLDLLVYIAVHRALARSDDAIISFNLLRSYIPEWDSPSFEITKEIANSFISIHKEVKDLLDHSLKERLLVYIRQNTAPFLILGSIIESNLDSIDEILDSSSKLVENVRKACQKLYEESGERLHTAAVRSIIYIFITKMMVAFVIELPLERVLFEEVNRQNLAINLLFPPFLMLVVARSIKVPGEKNTLRIIERVEAIAYPDGEQRIPGYKDKKSPSKKAKAVFGLVYLLAFLVSFGAIAWVLWFLDFSLVSGAMFFLFLSVVSFFAFRLRLTAREYVVLDKKDDLITSIFDFLSLPILKAGSWLSEGFAQINIFVFIFDFIIEAPFKTVVEIAEESLAFVREKKEELI